MRVKPKRFWLIASLAVIFAFTAIGGVFAADGYGQAIEDAGSFLGIVKKMDSADCEKSVAIFEKMIDAMWLGINDNPSALSSSEAKCLKNKYKMDEKVVKTPLNQGFKYIVNNAYSHGLTGYAGFLDAVKTNNLNYLNNLFLRINDSIRVETENELAAKGISFNDLMAIVMEIAQIEYEPGLEFTPEVAAQYDAILQGIVTKSGGLLDRDQLNACGLTVSNFQEVLGQLSPQEKADLEEILDKVGLIKHKPAATYEPADGATGVELDAQVKATFDRDVTAADLSGVKIEVGGAAMEGVAATLDGRVLTVGHSEFAFLKEYTVTVPAGAVQSEAGVDNDEFSWSFTTRELKEGDKPAATYEPADGATGVELNAQVKATFDRDVTAADLSGVKIEVEGVAMEGVAATLDGLVLTVGHPEFAYLTEYTVTVPAGAVQTEAGIDNDEFSWSFTTKDSTGGEGDKPAATYEPADGATGVELDAQVKATFDRDVTAADLSGVKIEVEGVAMEGVAATLDGLVLTVGHPEFAYLTEYTVTVPAGAVESTDGVGNDEFSWKFTTKDDDTPVGPYILTVQTDKAIYQLTQAVEVSGTLLENNEAQSPVPHVAVGLALYLGSEPVAFSQPTTDANGAFAWTIPAETLELGDYRLYATVNAARAEASFKVATEATGKPEVETYKPARDARNIQIGAEVSATFNMDVTAVDLEGVKIEKDGTALTGVSVTLDGRVLKLSHPAFSYRTTYKVTIPAGSVEGETGLLNDEASWSFATRSRGGGGGVAGGDSVYLGIDKYEPAKGAKDVETDANVRATFNLDLKAVNLGNIYIEDSKGKNVSGVKASISGKVLTIAHDEFVGGVTYKVVIPQKTVGVKNSSEVNTALSWEFTTAMKEVEECTFDDVTDSHWASSMIEELCLKNHINGYPDGNFKPDANITRAEMTKILVKVEGIKEADPDNPKFKDVKPGDWYYGYVEAAVDAGLVKGYETGEFRPNQKITREEIAALIARAMGKESEAASLANEKTTFTDDQNIASWARGYIVIEFREGIVDGYPDHSFAPKNNATRAEACAMFSRLIKYTTNE